MTEGITTASPVDRCRLWGGDWGGSGRGRSRWPASTDVVRGVGRSTLSGVMITPTVR